nr:MAG TPA: hypothetical protein [Caudoviricetes sp.]
MCRIHADSHAVSLRSLRGGGGRRIVASRLAQIFLKKFCDLCLTYH